jgi:hypothetical protein
MQKSSMVIGAATLLACTAAVMAQDRPPQVPSQAVQPPAEIIAPSPPAVQPSPPAVNPNRETTGAGNSARSLEPKDPVPKGGKKEDEDQTAPSAPKR